MTAEAQIQYCIKMRPIDKFQNSNEAIPFDVLYQPERTNAHICSFTSTGDWICSFTSTGDWIRFFTSTGDWICSFKSTGDWICSLTFTGDCMVACLMRDDCLSFSIGSDGCTLFNRRGNIDSRRLGAGTAPWVRYRKAMGEPRVH